MHTREGTHKSKGKRSIVMHCWSLTSYSISWVISNAPQYYQLSLFWLQATISVPPEQWCFWALWSFYQLKLGFFGAKATWSGAWRGACFLRHQLTWSLGWTATVSTWIWNYKETLLPQVFYASIADIFNVYHAVYYSSSNNVRMIVLIVFCSQGDNIQDAVSLTEHLDQWVSVTQHLVCTCTV